MEVSYNPLMRPLSRGSSLTTGRWTTLHVREVAERCAMPVDVQREMSLNGHDAGPYIMVQIIVRVPLSISTIFGIPN